MLLNQLLEAVEEAQVCIARSRRLGDIDTVTLDIEDAEALVAAAAAWLSIEQAMDSVDTALGKDKG